MLVLLVFSWMGSNNLLVNTIFMPLLANHTENHNSDEPWWFVEVVPHPSQPVRKNHICHPGKVVKSLQLKDDCSVRVFTIMSVYYFQNG